MNLPVASWSAPAERSAADAFSSVRKGASAEEIRADFPTLTPEVLRSVVAFAAASAEMDLPVPPLPPPA